MLAYVLRRLALAVPTLLFISAVTFFMGLLAPGDPVEIILGQHADPAAKARVRHELGLDRHPVSQYISYLANAVRGDLGISYVTRRPVTDILADGIPNTALLAVSAMAVALVVGVCLGVIAAVNQGRWLDRACMLAALAGVSIPTFVLGPLLILVFALKLGWLPVAGWGAPQHVLLPALVLAGRPAAMIARLTRAEMVEVLRQDYIRTARAKGLSEWHTITRHALRNALMPVVTVAGTSLGYLLSGSFVVESIFTVPGIGAASVESIFRRDYPVIQGTTLVMAASFVVVNLLVDLLYGWLDPRVQRSRGLAGSASG
jgi:peptide/nickel transport system permease protein